MARSNSLDAKDRPSHHGQDNDIDMEKGTDDGDITAKHTTIGDFEPTDGGYKAWSTVLGATLISLSTFGYALKS